MSGRPPPGKRLRLLRLGLSTVLGLRPRGFFIPYGAAADLPAEEPPYAAVEALFAAAAPAFRDLLDAADGQAAALKAIGADDEPPAPRWGQGWFPRLDAAIAYTLVRERRPRRLVEIGSGHSTRFLVRAAADAGLAVAFTAIDPQPRADLRGLPVAWIAAPVQRAGGGPFRDLAAGDVLFIDSSHVAMPGTDLDWLLGRVLPALPAGVLVHLHDIFLPDPYPAAWRWRGYNEQLLAIALLAGGGFTPLFASRYVATRMAAALAGSVVAGLPLRPGTPESSLWLLKTAPPLGPLPD